MRVPCDCSGITAAVKVVRAGGVVAYPTDTVYGIGCDPFDKKAVNKVYDIKQRSKSKPLPILGYNKQALEKIAYFDASSTKVAERFWPGMVTMILKLRDCRLVETLNLQDKVAVRVPSNHCIRSVLQECNVLVGTSANISEQGSFTDPDLCYNSVEGVDLFLDGGKIHQSLGESTIIDMTEKRIIRKGAVPEEEIMSLL